MIKTGIPILDDYLKGGIPIGKTVLYYATPGADSEVFGMQTAYSNLANNGVCYFVTSKTSPDAVRSGFKEYGWDLKPHSSRLAIVDDYSALVGAPSREPISVKDPQSIESIDETISSIIEIISPGDMLAFASISTIFEECGGTEEAGDELLEYIKKWNKTAALNGGIVVYSFNDRGYDPAFIERMKKGMCNASVIIGRVSGNGRYGQYFKLYSCDWSKPQELPTLYKTVRPGGIKIYIPKIIVTGPHSAGKSTFVRTAASLSQDKSVSVDRMGTTVAMDHAHIMLKGFTTDIFGTPGQARFAPIMKAIARDTMGIILIVDSTNPQDLGSAADILKTVNRDRTPYIVVANKQDIKGAMSAEEIRSSMNIPDSVPVMRASALDSADVERALESMINKIVEVR